MEPRVSVIIPTFKRTEKFVKRAIDSLVTQDYQNLEIIIIDDNANLDAKEYRENNKKLINSYKDDRIVYKENNKNLGGSLSRNEGIKVSTGDYITFLDDDDEYLPNKIKKQVEEMVVNNFDMSFSDLRICNQKGKTIDYREYSQIRSFENKELMNYHLTKHITGTPTFMYRANSLKGIGGFPDAKMGQEFYLMYNSIKNGMKIGYVPESNLIAYRHSNGGISMGYNKIIGEKALYSFKKQHFNTLKFRDKLFIRFRHHVILAIAFKRNKDWFMSLRHAVLAVILSPLDFLIEVTRFLYKISIK